jgi:WD40 repeat protein
VQIWDVQSWELIVEKTTGSKVARVAFSPDGKYLAWGNEAGELKLWTVGQWNEEREITGDLFRFQKVAFSPDSKLLAAVGGSFSEPRFGRGLVFEVESGKQIAKIESEAGAVMASVAFSPDGKELATGEYQTALRFWEPTTGKALSVIEIQGTMDTLEYTPDGTLVGPSYSGEVHILKNRALVRSLSGHEGRSLTARMSPNGRSLVSGGIDALIRVWNPETGVPVETIRPNESLEDTQEAVLAIAHSPDGRYVVTTHEDASSACEMPRMERSCGY